MIPEDPTVPVLIPEFTDDPERLKDAVLASCEPRVGEHWALDEPLFMGGRVLTTRLVYIVDAVSSTEVVFHTHSGALQRCYTQTFCRMIADGAITRIK